MFGDPFLNQTHRITHILLTPLYPPSRFGGIEKIVRCLAEGLSARNDDVSVFAFEPSSTLSNVPDHLNGVPVWRIPLDSGNASFSELISKQDEMVHAVADRRRVNSNAIIHAHDWFVGPAALSLSTRFDLPLVSIFHSDKHTEYGTHMAGDRRRIHECQKQLAQDSDKIFCYSEFMRTCISSSMNIPPSKIDVFRCGIDTDVSRKSTICSSNLLYLGRLAPEKDVATLIKAFARIVPRRQDCSLRIVGDGSERRPLEALVNNLGLSRNVVFCPFTSDADRIDAELLGADVLILPSRFEPFGLVVLEAISRQVPVIVPSYGGPSEIIEDGITGSCFVPGNHEDLAEKILWCLNNAKHAASMALAALEDARHRFRWDLAVSTVRDNCAGLLETQRSATGAGR